MTWPDNVTGLIDPLDRRNTLSYDALDRLATAVDPLGNATTYRL